eukprot:scaffold65088_cov36-Tisochrysis_lutea.AAC.1
MLGILTDALEDGHLELTPEADILVALAQRLEGCRLSHGPGLHMISRVTRRRVDDHTVDDIDGALVSIRSRDSVRPFERLLVPLRRHLDSEHMAWLIVDLMLQRSQRDEPRGAIWADGARADDRSCLSAVLRRSHAQGAASRRRRGQVQAAAEARCGGGAR